jgi:hypothetical protein
LIRPTGAGVLIRPMAAPDTDNNIAIYIALHVALLRFKGLSVPMLPPKLRRQQPLRPV